MSLSASKENSNVAVCIPVRGRREDLRRLLSRLSSQEWTAGQLRVVVAIDGSDRQMAEEVRESGWESVTSDEQRGSYAARNSALDYLADWPDLVLFTDSDCIPGSNWIAAHVEALRFVDLSGGAIEVTTGWPPTPAEVVDRTRHLRQEDFVNSGGYAATANLGVRRAVADLRFDSRLKTGGDAEFCRRAVAAGFRLGYSRAAVVEHPARRSTGAVLAKVLRLARGVTSRAPVSRRIAPFPRPRRSLAFEARRAGLSQGYIWDVHAVTLDFLAELLIWSAHAWASRPGSRRSGHPPRVAYLVKQFPVRSQTFVSNEVEEARRQGLELVVCALEPAPLGGTTRPEKVVSSLRPSTATLGVELLRLALRPTALVRFGRAWASVRDECGRPPGRVDIRRLAVLARDLRAQRINVVHAHFAWEAATAAWLLSSLLRARWSFTAHANDIFGRPVNFHSKAHAADRVVTVCRYNEGWIREHFGYAGEIDLVICGVEVPALLSDRGEKAVDVLAVGRLVDKKGFDVLIDAIAALRTAGRRVTCEIIGDGPLRESLERQVATLECADCVHLVGSKPHSEVLERLWDTRLLCVPSRIAATGDRDSMPVIAKEAMARAVPVVGTTVGGIPEMVDHTCGRIVPPDDATSLGAAIAEVLEDDPLRADLGLEGRRRVLERFTLRDEVAKMVNIFREMA